jgi:hypothetical protein
VSGGHERGAHYLDDASSPATPGRTDELPPISCLPVASAAVALASLYHHKIDSDYESEPVSLLSDSTQFPIVASTWRTIQQKGVLIAIAMA